MQGNVTILVTWANAMQASWFYRCAEALRWCSTDAGKGCRPAVAIDALRLCAGALWMQGNGCRVPAGVIDALRPDAGQRWLLTC